MVRAIYIALAQGYLYISREGNTLLVRYLLDTRARYSTYFTEFQVPEGLHRGPEFSHNHKKVNCYSGRITSPIQVYQTHSTNAMHNATHSTTVS